MDNLTIKVINLDRRPERWDIFLKKQKNTALQKYNAERFSAINGVDILEDIGKKKLTGDPIFKLLSKLNTEIAKGELGCLLSHYFVFKEIMLDDNLQENDLVLVFEDDVFFTDYDIQKYLNHIDEFIKTNTFDILYVSGRWKPHYIPKNLSFFDRKSRHMFLRMNGSGYDWDRGNIAYILTKNGAKKFYHNVLNYFEKNKIWTAIDKIVPIKNENIVSYDFFPHIFYSPVDYQTDIQCDNMNNTIKSTELNKLC